MRPGKATPKVWLFSDERLETDLPALLRRLPEGIGIVFRHHDLPPAERRLLLRRARRLAAARGLVLVEDSGGRTARVHDLRELRRALLSRGGAGPELLFISPLHPTRTHPDWRPLPRMRAATLARLAGRMVLALGGMNAKRFRQVRTLGFSGWGGIDAFEDRPKGSAAPRT